MTRTGVDSGGTGLRQAGRDITGNVVQAGAVHGDIHFHTTTVSPLSPIVAGPDRAPSDHDAHALTSGSSGRSVVPRSLPRDLAEFTGRESELRRLLIAVGLASGGGATAVAIHAIDGMPGIGKTTLGVHAAHTLAPKYPDGTLFLNLWGHTPGQEPRDPFDALHALMVDIGVRTDVLARHNTLDDRARLWRSLVATRRLLIVLDDAVDHHQVTPLLPGTRGSLVLITSRNRLPGLDGVHPLTLDVLPHADADRMLWRLAHRTPEPAEADHVTRLVDLCGRLPLAIAITASQLRAHPTWPIRRLADTLSARLAQDTDRLEEFDYGDRSVRASFDTSFRDLPADLRSMFTLLGVHHGPEIDAPAAAALAGITPARAQRALDALHVRHLVQETSPGRYRLHDLLRAYAHTHAGRLDPAFRWQATSRALDYYLHTAHAATRVLPARRTRSTPITPTPPAHPTPIATTDHAVDWLTTELPTLATAVEHTHTTHPTHTLHLSNTLYPYFRAVGHWRHSSAMLRTAHTTARRTGDLHAQAAVLNDLGYVRRRQGDLNAALAAQTQAFELHTRSGNPRGQAATLTDLGYVHLLRGELGAARDTSKRAVDLYALGGDLLDHANALNNLGRVHLVRGEVDEAADTLARAVDVYRRSEDPLAQANALNNLGYVHVLRGSPDQAVDTQTRALDLHIRRGDLLGQANAHLGVGIARHRRHEPGPARSHLAHALRLFTRGEDNDGQAETHNALGDLALDQHDGQTAHAHYTTALGLARACGTRLHEANALIGEARCLHGDGDLVQAASRLREALTIQRAMNSHSPQAASTARLLAALDDEQPNH
ncbi:tetratricopeptide repeat protein [Saccharothrix sp. 6-C]|uniref:tetratricopeptide repeat protein n=1 Tax=Saccharothrix sp. 6-C TaxID=2781735 RepID=UPI00191761C8|nr:tetratricopeptide repeat protein [Saccharothrix sp. 6-C]QQQ73463.1 tetratricopeptide repeat protein [Saccharothrix sp. 6-C]